MRKYLIFLFIYLLIPFSLLAVPSITLTYIGMQGEGGTSDQNVYAGETVEVEVKYTTVEMDNVQGPFYSSSNHDRVRMLWYDNADPNSGTYLSGTGVDISDWSSEGIGTDKIATFQFDVPTSGIPSGALSFQVLFGLYGEDDGWDPFEGQRYTSYITYGSYSACSGNPQSGWFEYIEYDGFPDPTLTRPAASGSDNATLNINFYIPVIPNNQSVKLTFTRTSGTADPYSPHVIIMQNEYGNHTYVGNYTITAGGGFTSPSHADLTIDGGVSSNHDRPLVDGTIYTIKCEYTPSGASAEYVENTNFTYDTTTQTPTLDIPVNDAIISTKPFTVQFDQPETALATSVKIIFTRTGGNADSGSPHTLTVTSEASGNNKTVSIDGDDFSNNTGTDPATGNLVSGTIYTVKIQYQDELGNPVTYDENTNIEYSYGDPIVFASGGDYGAASFFPDSDNNAFFRLQLYWNNSGLQPTVTSIEFDIIGTYSSTDVKSNGMKLWRSTDNSFSATSDTQIGSSMDIADPITFTGLTETIPVSSGYYYFVTVDVSSTAEGSDEIGAEVDQASHITTAATVSGTFPISGNTHPLPVTLSDFSVQFVSGHPTIYWTTQSETNNMGWNIYRSISQNMGQAIHVNAGDLIEGQGTVTEPTDYVYVDMHGVDDNTTYYYWLESVETSGETELFGPISLTIPEGGGSSGTPATPDDYGLKQNYPNPFNPDTEIRFALEEASYSNLTIYNIKGEKVKTIFEGYVPADLIQTAVWNGKDESGKDVASGIYLYKLATKHDTFVKKMLLAK
ncbi:MAG: T9SS type A sorting domain-containing protein [Candidatus Cloacimonetes bacterium]|nr:T9SS type A sorting domain-containing protein [Candidatus Cloacimonadota bacterium]